MPYTGASLRKKETQPPDLVIFLLVLGLVTFGWVMVYSASAFTADLKWGNQYHFFNKQVAWSAIGFGGLLVALRTPYENWQRWAKPLLGTVLMLLVAVLILGHQVGGAQRWLRLGPLGFQPSELAKLAMIISLADFLDRHQSHLRFFWTGFLPGCLIFGVLSSLVLLQPDLGTCVLIGATGFVMLLTAGARWPHCLALSLLGAAAVCLSILKAGYRQQRVLAYLDPWKDPQGSGYQLVQSLLAIGSGGLFGKGLGNSKLKIHYLPDSHTDFIFSIIGEEMGLLGTFLVLFLFAVLVVRGLQIARHAPNWFGTLAAVGVVAMISLQALIHLSVSVGLLPTKGIPLPFLSFGGSSLVVTLLSCGILLNISRYAHRPVSERDHVL